MNKRCAVCGKNIKVTAYKDKTYRGGHYFGKIPLHRKAELLKATKAGTRKVVVGRTVLNVLRRDPKPYAHREYWECAKCYR